MQDFSPSSAIQRSLVKRFRKELWQPFVAACKRYALVPEGARVTVVRDGTSAMLLASLLLEELHRHSDVPFELEISAAADEGPHPPPLCGGPPSPFRGRQDDGIRTALVSPERGDAAAAAERFPRLVVPDCMSDVTETLLTAMLREGECRGVLPAEGPDEGGVIRIRPLYCIEEKDIRAFCRYNRLPYVPRTAAPERQMARGLLETVKREDPDAEIRVFRALHAVRADTFPKLHESENI